MPRAVGQEEPDGVAKTTIKLDSAIFLERNMQEDTERSDPWFNRARSTLYHLD